MSGIVLTKGSGINLSKAAPGLKRVRVGLGWDPDNRSPYPYDLDASVFICRDINKPRLLSNEHFVFYNQPSEPERAVRHTGDSKDGSEAATGGADEELIIDLGRLNPTAEELSFVVTIHEADVRGQNFGQVRNSFISLTDEDTGKEIARYRLEDEFATATAVQFGSLYRENGEWTFKAIGAGSRRGLADYVLHYGGTLG